MSSAPPIDREALVRRIEALRRELGEAPRRPRSALRPGVSGRNVSATIAAAARIGVSRASLAEGVSFPLEPAERTDAWIAWDEFHELLGRVAAHAGEDALRGLGEHALESPLFRAVGVLAGTLLTERDLFEWVLRLVFRDDGLYFRGVEGRVEARDRRHLRVVYESRGATFARPFALALAGITEQLPRMVGRAPARVHVDVTRERLVLHVTLARRESLARTAARAIGLGGAAASSEALRDLYTELVETNQRAAEKLEALEASRAASRELEGRLAQVRQMQVVGRFAGALAHELNNLLTVIMTTAALVSDDPSEDDETRRHVGVIEEIAERAAELTRELRGLGAGEPGAAAPVDLVRIVADVRPLLEDLLRPVARLEVELCDAPAGARVEPASVERVLTNLVVNARDATTAGGTVRVTVRPVRLDAAFVAAHPGTSEGDHVLLSVRDDGAGMTDEVRARVFEPYFTTRADAGGSGVGLATVYAFATGAGGTVWVDSAPGAGATFRLYLPRVELDAREADDRPPAAPSSAQRRSTVLFVDDDDRVRAATRRLLAGAGYDVAVAESGDAGLALVDAGLRPAIVVSDVVMPGTRGLPLAQAFRERLGPVPILFVSGYTDRVLDGDLGAATELLPKPYRSSELLARVARLLGGDGGR